MTANSIEINKPVKQKSKLKYLEGIRGLAAFMVLLHHYFLAFYPASANGNSSLTHFAPFELWYHKSPLVFLTTGQLYVYIFFILSGFVLSRKFFQEKNYDYLVSASIRRFPRLYIPVAFSLLIALLLIKLDFNYYTVEARNITKSIWLKGVAPDISIPRFLYSFFYKVMFLGDNHYNTVLWTISVELFGSFFVFGTLALLGNSKHTFLVYITVFILLAMANNFLYSAFVLGVLLNYSNDYQFKNKIQQRLIIIVLLLTGLILGGFPEDNSAFPNPISGTFYKHLNYPFIVERGALINQIGAFFIVLAAQHSNKLKNFFSSRILRFFGDISFSMYLIHALVITSFSSFVFLKLISVFNYNASFLIDFVCSLILIFVSSYFMAIYVDRKSLRASQYIYDKYFKNEQVKPINEMS